MYSSGNINSGELERIEVLSARLLHDLAGSVNAVINYVECLAEDLGADLSKLEEASEDMVARFRLLRQAYSGSEDNSSFANTRNNIEKYLNKRGIEKLTWNIDEASIADAELVEKINRMLSHAVLFSVMLMIQGKEIAVSLRITDSGVKVCVALVAAEVVIHKDIADLLAHKGNDVPALNTKNAQAYFMLLLLNKYGAALNCDIENKVLEIDAPF